MSRILGGGVEISIDAPASPVTGGRTELVDRISVTELVGAYQSIGLEVGSAFRDMDAVDVYECQDSAYRFFYPHELAADAAFYAQLQQTPGYYADWRWEHGRAEVALDGRASILEIGTGTGNFLARLRDTRGRRVVGLELNRDALRVARERGLDVHEQTIEAFSPGHAGEFDAVCSFQVLEHVPAVQAFLDSACAVLKPGGRLILGVPNNQPYLYKYDRLHALNLPPHHMGLWNRSSLESLTRFFPMSLIDIEVEPLDDPGHYWSVYLEHLRRKGTALPGLLARLPWRVTRLLLRQLQARADGRNLVALYERRAL